MCFIPNVRSCGKSCGETKTASARENPTPEAAMNTPVRKFGEFLPAGAEHCTPPPPGGIMVETERNPPDDYLARRFFSGRGGRFFAVSLLLHEAESASKCRCMDKSPGNGISLSPLHPAQRVYRPYP